MAAVSSRRPRRMLAIWGLVVVVALVLAGTSLKGLTTTPHVVGATQSSQAEALYNEVVGSASQKPTDVIVVSSKSSTASDQDFKVFVGRLEAKVGTSPGITDVVANFGSGSPLVSDNRHAALISLRAATDADIKPVVQPSQSANGRGGFSVAVTGDHTVDNDFSTLATSDLRHGELDFGLPIAIVVLLLVFGAVVAGLMPVLMALLSILVGLGIATLVGEEFHLSTFIVNMMTAMGLALGIDYSLFVISRFREERARGLDKETAIQRTAATASRAVLFSGSTFVIALLGMFLVPTNILRSLAAGAVIVGVVSVAAALTLLPAMLQLLGDRVNSLRLPIVGKRLGNTGSGESRIWRTFIEAVLRRRVVMLTLAVGLMVALAVPLLGIHVGQSGVATLPNSLPSKQGYLAVQRYFPNQDPYPVEIVADGGDASTRGDLSKLEAILAGNSRFGSGTVEASANGKVLALTVPIRGDVVSSPDVAAVRQLRSDRHSVDIHRFPRPRLRRGQNGRDGRLLQRGLGAHPVCVAVCAGPQLHLAAAGVPVARYRPCLDRAQSPVGRCGIWPLDPGLHPRDWHELLRLPEGDRHRRLGAAVPVLGALCPLDGLPGLPHESDQGTL